MREYRVVMSEEEARTNATSNNCPYAHVLIVILNGKYPDSAKQAIVECHFGQAETNGREEQKVHDECITPHDPNWETCIKNTNEHVPDIFEPSSHDRKPFEDQLLQETSSVPLPVRAFLFYLINYLDQK